MYFYNYSNLSYIFIQLIKVMYIKGKYKIIRKHDCDFWNLTYYRLIKNKFFWYFKFSLLHRMKDMFFKKQFRLPPKNVLQIVPIQGLLKERSFYNPFLNKIDRHFIKYKQLNFYKLFLKRGLRYTTHIYRRLHYYRHASSKDLLLGTKSNFRIYKPKTRSLFQRQKMFFKEITLFYNNFDNIKLKRFGKLGRKGQFGGVNFFFFLLESRVDSIVLRLNYASRFILRELIKSRKVLVGDKVITYMNYIVKKHTLVTFVPEMRRKVLRELKRKLKKRVFFVQPPFYLEINYRTLMILIVPKLIDPSFVPYPFLKSKSSLLAGLHTILWGW